MRRPPAFWAALVLPVAFFAVAACGGGSGGSGGAKPTTGLPGVSGSYGDKPTLSFSGTPSTTLQKKVLKDGTGTAIAKGDLMVADYLGQIWDGTVFDNSYDRKQPFGTPIGLAKVIPGWDEALVGVKSGSRVLLAIPPDKGYGPNGNSQAGIKGTDTLVFVIDVIAAFGAKSAGDPKAADQHAATPGVTIGGTLGARPTVAVTKGTATPKKPTTIVLAKGTGPAVKTGFLVLQYEVVNWVNKAVASTWKDGAPAGLPIGSAQQPNPFDALVGVPIGSRVLVQIPQSKDQKTTESLAVVVDVIAEPGTAKETAAS